VSCSGSRWSFEGYWLPECRRMRRSWVSLAGRSASQGMAASQEEKCPDELAGHRYHVVSRLVGDLHEEGHARRCWHCRIVASSSGTGPGTSMMTKNARQKAVLRVDIADMESASWSLKVQGKWMFDVSSRDYSLHLVCSALTSCSITSSSSWASRSL
jgi:hypothetical protein